MQAQNCLFLALSLQVAVNAQIALLPDCLQSLTVCLRALQAPAQFIATTMGEEAQIGPAEKFGDIGNHVERTLLF